MANFTPEDVVRRYRELGAKPSFGVLGLDWEYGSKFMIVNGCACAIGVMLAGRPYPQKYLPTSQIVKNELDVDYWAFADGFDNIAPTPDCDYSEPYASSYRLGQECRAAVLAADLAGEG